MAMKNPPHPGEHIRHDCIEPLGLSITAAAEALGVARQTLNNVIRQKRHLTRDGDTAFQSLWR